MHKPAAALLALAAAQCAPMAAQEKASSPTMPAPSLESSPNSTSSSARNAALVRELYERVINQRRLDLLAQYISEDYVGPRGERGPSGFSQTVEALVAGVPDIRFELEDVFATEERAAVRWRWSGKHTGTLFGLKPSGVNVQNSGIALYSFANGKVVGSVVETDRLGLLQQMGVVSPDLGAPRVVKEP